MRIPFAFAMLLAASSTVFGQVYKCPGAGGKMEYSDTPCAGSNSQQVNIITPSFGSPPGAGNDANTRALQILQADRARRDARHAAKTTCTFNYFSSGDEKGRLLAQAAKEECLRNVELQAAGQPVSMDAYHAWKDHHDMTANRRQAAAATAATNRAAAAAESATRRSTTCRRGIGAELVCN